MPEKKYLATITILIKDRQSRAVDMQKILTENGHIIMARLGVNVQKSCVENCTGLITIVVEAGKKEINSLTKKLNSLYGVTVKLCVISE